LTLDKFVDMSTYCQIERPGQALPL